MPDRISTQVWLDFIAACPRVATTEELGDLAVESYRRLGYDYINISLMRDYDLPRDKLKFGWKSTYPEHWARYYIDHDCVRIDPVALCARGDVGPFFWSDLELFVDLTPLQIRFLNLARKAGLYNGIGLPFVGPRSRQGGIALATRAPDSEHVRDLYLLWSISNLFHMRLLELINGRARLADKTVELTPRELDIINLSGKGYTDRDIAADLDISENTVNTYQRQIYRKFGAHTRVEAVVMAVKQHIIDLP